MADIEAIADNVDLHETFKAVQQADGTFTVLDLDTKVARNLSHVQVRAYMSGVAYSWSNCIGISLRLGVYSKTGVLIDTIEQLIEPVD